MFMKVDKTSITLLRNILDCIEHYGAPAAIRENEIPVFWACGVTPQAVALESKPVQMITHSPGHMFITDLRDEDLAVL